MFVDVVGHVDKKTPGSAGMQCGGLGSLPLVCTSRKSNGGQVNTVRFAEDIELLTRSRSEP